MIGSAMNGNTEALSVSIQQRARKWIDITNIYIPPRAESTEIDWLPVSETCLIAGDLNGHSPLWDQVQPEDPMGTKIVDFSIAKELICCNNGEPTRVNRNTGGMSTPDVTLASKNLHNRVQWNTELDLGSDHLPIIIELQNCTTRTHQVPKRYRQRWKRTKVDWHSFAEQIEEKLEGSYHRTDNLNQRVKVFTRIMTDAGYTHVGKTTPRVNRVYMTPAVQTAVKKRNLLRRDIANKRVEWLEACREVKELTKEAKEQSWVDYLGELEDDPDPTRVWRTIKNLSGTPDSPAPNEALIHKGKAITSFHKKADIFAKHYAKVSKLEFSKEERSRNREFKRMMQMSSVDEECCKDFDLGELNAAIKAMKPKGAAGKDNIPPTFLKNLGPKALEELLAIFNPSFKSAEIPASWKHAVIIPILKVGKPASQLGSYRPISLTSCLVKTLERMINSRLYHIAELKGWITNSQAGFRKQRSCEDQILRITQAVSDNLQQKPSQRTMMVLIDYSKAYDRVWKEDLMIDMINMGCPMQIMRWVRAFLTNRTAQVLYNGAYSRTVLMCQGLPQGAVISPLLFLFFINGLETVIPEDVANAMFADDASIWTSHSDLNEANIRIQRALTAIEEWSKKKKMEINVTKSEVTFFSNCSHEAKWRPNLTLNNTAIPYNDSPKFLGVHLDRTLSFQKHTLYVADKVSKRCRILASLASKSWGWKKKSLRSVYITMQRSVMDYAAPAWQPWLSATQLNKLEVAQNKALRLISGQHASTPLEALRLETGIGSYSSTSKQLTAKAYEKANRLPENHPRYQALSKNKHVQHRIKKRSSWREQAVKITGSLPIANLPRAPLPSPFQQPWSSDQALHQWKVNTTLPSPSNHTSFSNFLNNSPWGISVQQNTHPTNSLTEVAIQTIDKFSVDTVIYTDGSCKAGTENGGSAAIITTGSARDPIVLETIKKKGCRYTCSYDEERAAMALALDWMTIYNQYTDTVICSDSQSLLTAIENSSPDTSNIRKQLSELKGRVTLQWVPSHSKVPGNELADQAAKEATEGEADPVPVTYNSAVALIKRDIRDPPPVHNLVAQTYQHISLKKDSMIKSRKDAVLLAQLRSGHCNKLASYRNRIDSNKPDICPKCEEVPETVQHWLKCPATIRKRTSIFGMADVHLGALTSKPEEVLTFAKATLLEESS